MRKLIYLLSLCLVSSIAFPAQQPVNVGTSADDHTGDPARTAFMKLNANDAELYGKFPVSVANGGTGAITITGVLKGNGTSAITAASVSDLLGLFTGTCTVSVPLRGDGSCGTLPSSAVTGLAASATTDTTNAANISSGALPAGRLPALTGDCTTTIGTVATTCTTTGGVAFATSATTDTTNAGNISSGTLAAGRGGTGSGTVPTAGQLPVGNAGNTAYAPATISGDATLASTGALTVTKTSGVSFAASATTDATNATNISNGTLASARGGAGAITGALKGNGSGVVSQAACADLSNAAASCSTDTTNANNISAGTLGAARLPNPSATTLGGIESLASVSHKWINTISTAGVPSATQPAAADISGLAASATTDTTNAANITTGILAAANGGTSNGFTAFSGPATSTKTFTLPNATANILTDNAAVTVAQGGTGVGTLTAHGVLLGEGTSNVSAVAALAADNLLLGQGATSDPAAVALTNCGDATHALAYSTSTHTFSCQAVTGSAGVPGGSTTQVQFNLTGAFAGDAGFTYVGSSTQTVTLGTTTVGPTINAATSSAVGRAFSINGSSGVGINAGGAINITAGTASGTAGAGGAISITGGTGSSTVNSLGGAATFAAGTATGSTAGPTATFQGGGNNSTGAGGVAQLLGGAGGTTSGNGGAVTVQGGTPTVSGNGGAVTVQGGTAGNAAGNTGGAVTIQAGTATATTTGAAGSAVTINGGTATGSGNNTGGNITLTAGAAANAAAGGTLALNGGTVGSSTGIAYHNVDIRGGTTLANLNVGTGGSSNLSSVYIQGSNSAANSVNGGDILIAGGLASATSSVGGNIVVRTGGTSTTSSNGNIVFQFINESTAAPQTMFTFNGHTGALGLGSSPAYGSSGNMLVSAGSGSAPTWTSTISPVISGGTKFTTSGCSVSSTTGGGAAGIFTLGANSCTVVITLNGATGTTAPTGWSCQAHDRTAPTVLIGGESSSTTTTASITIPAGAGATDVISFSCTGY